MPNVFCNQDSPGVVSQKFSNNFRTTDICFLTCVAKCQPRGVTAKDICRRSWLLQRILLCHCDPIVPPVPLWEAARRAASEQNHNSGMTTHTVKVLYNSVLCPCQFFDLNTSCRRTQVLIQVSIFHLCIQTTLDTCFASFLLIFWYPEVTAFQKGHLTLCLNEVLGSDTMKISRKEGDSTLRLVAAAAAYISVLYRGQVSWTCFQKDSFCPSSSLAWRQIIRLQTQDLLPVHLKLRVENLLCIMLHSVFWFQVSLQIADGDATVKQIGGTSGSDRSSDLLETDVFSVIGGEDAKRQSKLLNLRLNFLSQESGLCVGARQKYMKKISMRYNVARDQKIN